MVLKLKNENMICDRQIDERSAISRKISQSRISTTSEKTNLCDRQKDELSSDLTKN